MKISLGSRVVEPRSSAFGALEAASIVGKLNKPKDVWALGCTQYEIHVSTPLFDPFLSSWYIILQLRAVEMTLREHLERIGTQDNPPCVDEGSMI
jgi:serine/threonine protein kinase